jgi:hypothetical protein
MLPEATSPSDQSGVLDATPEASVNAGADDAPSAGDQPAPTALEDSGEAAPPEAAAPAKPWWNPTGGDSDDADRGDDTPM